MNHTPTFFSISLAFESICITRKLSIEDLLDVIFLSLNISKIFIIKYNFTMYNVLRVLIIFLSLNSFSLLGNDIKIIRDAETESFFEELAKPILNTAKINEDSVSFYLDHQKYINAFVTGGYNIFYYRNDY